ncbi:hypothetical protein K502DRAFT_341122 [Neoconidiobolus thromboides FSU 785]|nr:hypothetical protein K502DRAFT_341122 [Neoconidiobolus thromboides FSU 785]
MGSKPNNDKNGGTDEDKVTKKERIEYPIDANKSIINDRGFDNERETKNANQGGGSEGKIEDIEFERKMKSLVEFLDSKKEKAEEHGKKEDNEKKVGLDVLTTMKKCERIYLSKRVVMIHPLPIINITDHFTRIDLLKRNPENRLQVIGILLGAQGGNKVEVVNSIELKVNVSSKDNGINVAIDKEFLKKRLIQAKAVFPKLTVIGWYSIGSIATKNELVIQEEYFSKLSTSLIFLQFNPKQTKKESMGSKVQYNFNPHNRTNLPVKVYEIHSIQGEESYIETLDCYIEANKTQRMALDTINQTVCTTSTENKGIKVARDLDHSLLLANVNKQKDAINIMLSKLNVVVDHLEKVSEGKTKTTSKILRHISSVAHKLPKANSGTQFAGNAMAEAYNGLLLNSYFNGVIKNIQVLKEVTSIVGLKAAFKRKYEPEKEPHSRSDYQARSNSYRRRTGEHRD